MSDEKQAQGKLDGFEIAKRKDGTEIKGKKTDGTPYTNYKYKIGNRFYSGFKKLSEFEPPVEIGEYVIVVYKEEPNPTNSERPYKNIVNIIQAVAPEEQAESDKAVNMKPVDKPTDEPIGKETNWEEINEKKQKNIQVTACFHRTLDFILSKKELTVDSHFDDLFEKLWNKVENKRKEKLG